jgi:hypothetical protein
VSRKPLLPRDLRFFEPGKTVKYLVPDPAQMVVFGSADLGAQRFGCHHGCLSQGKSPSRQGRRILLFSPRAWLPQLPRTEPAAQPHKELFFREPFQERLEAEILRSRLLRF